MSTSIGEFIKEQLKDVPLTINDIMNLKDFLRELIPSLINLQNLNEEYCNKCKLFEELLSSEEKIVFLEIEVLHEKCIGTEDRGEYFAKRKDFESLLANDKKMLLYEVETLHEKYLHTKQSVEEKYL